MPRFRDKRAEREQLAEAALAAAAPPPAGPQLLFDGPVLASWFLMYRLRQEIDRARRYGSCLSVLVAEPQFIVGEKPSEPQTLAAAEAANALGRSTDLVGWYEDRGVILVLPEADAASARFAATRLRDEIWIRSHSVGNQKWQVQLVDDLDEIQALLDQIEPSAAAAEDTPAGEQAA